MDIFEDLFREFQQMDKKDNPDKDRLKAQFAYWRKDLSKPVIAKHIGASAKLVKSLENDEITKDFVSIALFADNYAIASQGIGMLNNPTSQQQEIQALCEFQDARYSHCLYFQPEELTLASSHFAKHVSEYAVRGNTSVFDLLAAIQNPSPSVFAFAGILHFNAGNHDAAHAFLDKLGQPRSSALQLAQLQARHRIGVNVMADIPGFYARTGSQLSAHELQERLDSDTIPVPRFKLGSLYGLAQKYL